MSQSDLGRSGPGLDGFRALAAKHRLVPVWRELVADTITPVAAFLQHRRVATAVRASSSSRSRGVSAGAATRSWDADPLATMTVGGRPGDASRARSTSTPPPGAG